MDMQNRVGVKAGSGAPASASEVEKERKDRVRRMQIETTDLTNDPYILRNHLGTFECRLCLT